MTRSNKQALGPRWIWLALACLVTLTFGGCANMTSVTSQVSSFASWPEGRKPGRYVFERLPSQQSQPSVQDKLEAAAQPGLAAAGFEWVADASQADVSVQVGAQMHMDQRRRAYDPFWGPWGPAWGGWWGGGRGGMSMSMSMEPVYVQMQVDVLIRDKRSNVVLYETHARYDRIGAVDDRLYPYLFEAALKDFPHQAVSPRAVTVTIPPDNH